MDQFNVEIKLRDKLPQNDCGYCVTRGRKGDSYEICVSTKAHNTVAEFGSTLLHELLHLWVYILKVYGYHVKLKYEHMWIRAVETVIINFMDILKQGKKDEIKRRNQ